MESCRGSEDSRAPCERSVCHTCGRAASVIRSPGKQVPWDDRTAVWGHAVLKGHRTRVGVRWQREAVRSRESAVR